MVGQNQFDQSTTDNATTSTIPQPVDEILDTLASQINSPPKIQPLLAADSPADSDKEISGNPQTSATQNAISNPNPNPSPNQDQQSQKTSPLKSVVTKVKLSDELNIFDWFRTTDIINQIAEKAKNSVDSVITALDPGMKEYLYSGGNINIIVISDSDCLVSPIRDAFQYVFGRATVVAARYNPPEAAAEYPVKLACGFDEAIIVAQERIKKLRLDTNNVPQNQVVVAVQPCLVSVINNETAGSRVTNGLNLDENLLPKWFLSYCMLIEDPVLGATLNSYSQFIPIDTETIALAKEAKFPEDFTDNHLGFAVSIDDLMIAKLNLKPREAEDEENAWLPAWSGLNEGKVVHDLSISLAHLYRRKWNACVN